MVRVSARQAFTLVSLLLASAPGNGAYAADDPGPAIYEAMAPGTLLIRVTGVRNDGGITNSAGTGFVVSDQGLVLTAGHVVPDKSDHKSLILTGTFGPATNGGTAYQVELVKRSEKLDVAVLRILQPPPQLRTLPLRASRPKAGEIVFVLGYPLGLPDTHFLDGRIGAVEADAITTNVLVDHGNSGGPVLDAKGCVVGVVYGAIESIQGQPVHGIKFAVPVFSLADFIPTEGSAAASVPSSVSTQDFIHVSDTLTRTRTDHGFGETVRAYHDVINARPGYVFEAVEAVGHVSLNRPRLQFPNPVISGDRKSMSFDYSLISGPIYDQRRGWIEMTISTKQRRTGTAAPPLSGGYD